MNNGEVEGQLNRKLVYDYALKCLTPECTFLELHQAQQILQAAPFTNYLVAAKDAVPHEDKTFLRIDGSLAFSALKPAEGGTPGELILRLFNISEREESAVLHFGKSFRKAEMCRLDESCVEPLAENADTLNITAASWQILTLKITMNP